VSKETLHYPQRIIRVWVLIQEIARGPFINSSALNSEWIFGMVAYAKEQALFVPQAGKKSPDTVWQGVWR
jgi:hypothetical protein